VTNKSVVFVLGHGVLTSYACFFITTPVSSIHHSYAQPTMFLPTEFKLMCMEVSKSYLEIFLALE
jgi:hypothetical protein